MQTLTFIIILLMTLVFIGLSTGFGFYVAGKVFHDIKGKWKGGTDGIMTVIVFVAVEASLVLSTNDKLVELAP